MEAAIYWPLLVLVAILSVISVIDLKTKTIPDTAVICLALAGVWSQWVHASAIGLLANMAFYFSCFWLIRQGHKVATNRIGLGFGDVKMAGAAGAWITIGAAPLFIGIAASTALIAVALGAIIRGSDILKQRIPFAPFLAIGLLVCWILQVSNISLDNVYDVFSST